MKSLLEENHIFPYGAIPNKRQLEHMKMEKKAFIHFGVNTFTDLEWGLGDESEKTFNPEKVDTDQWIRVIKDAGFKLVILTAKHHDGFCLWPSAYTTHTVRNSPYQNGKGDIVRDFSDSCRKYGLKMGIYISPWDRSVKEWGTPEYSIFFANQLRELLTNYGKIDEVWWDGAGSSETEYNWSLWGELVRTLQPTAAIFGSNGELDTVDLRWVGNELGVAGATHFASINCECIKGLPTQKLNKGEQNGNVYLFSETDVSIRPGWFYHKEQDGFVKNPTILDNIWFTSVGRNSNLLLNFPPNREGVICETDAKYAKISNENINKMLSVDYAKGASILADTQLLPETNTENLTDDEFDTFYASAKGTKKAILDITLSAPSKINVLILGEFVEYGERINSFKLCDVSSGEEKILCEGTSVGYKRAIKFPLEEYSKLRLYLCGEDSVILSRLNLHYYEKPMFQVAEYAYGINVVKAHKGVNFSEDKKSVILSFGGIFDFNYLEAELKSPAEYELYMFDGQDFHLVKQGESKSENLCIKLDSVISESYQIKLKINGEFSEEPKFKVSLEK